MSHPMVHIVVFCGVVEVFLLFSIIAIVYYFQKEFRHHFASLRIFLN